MMGCYDPECSCHLCDGSDSPPVTLAESAEMYDLACLLEREQVWAELEYLTTVCDDIDAGYYARQLMRVVEW